MFESDEDRANRERAERLLKREEWLTIAMHLIDKTNDVQQIIDAADVLIAALNKRYPI